MTRLTTRDESALVSFYVTEKNPHGILVKSDGVPRQTVDRLVRLGLVRIVNDRPAVPAGASNWGSPSAWAASLTDTGRKEHHRLTWATR